MAIGVKIVENDFIELSAVMKVDDRLWTAEHLNYLASKINNSDGKIMNISFSIDANGYVCLNVIMDKE
jgi:hypothetical protein